MKPQRPDFAAYGRKGARIRLRRLSAEERSEIARRGGLARAKQMPKAARSAAARKAVQARWAKANAKSRDV